jgi:alpha-ketoglutarate-dependent 2,4-dichlorophenoxyacetate dioxygenase
MDEFGVLVFRDQDIDDEQQVAFSRALGPLESATGDIAKPEERRLSMDVNDISNVDKDNKVVRCTT